MYNNNHLAHHTYNIFVHTIRGGADENAFIWTTVRGQVGGVQQQPKNMYSNLRLVWEEDGEQEDSTASVCMVNKYSKSDHETRTHTVKKETGRW